MWSSIHEVVSLILLISPIIGFIAYRVMLRQMREWNLPVDESSWGMSFQPNLRMYLAATKNGTHNKGRAFWVVILSIVLFAVCFLYLFVYERGVNSHINPYRRAVFSHVNPRVSGLKPRNHCLHILFLGRKNENKLRSVCRCFIC